MSRTDELLELTRCFEGIMSVVDGKLSEEDNVKFKRYMLDLIDALERKWSNV